MKANALLVCAIACSLTPLAQADFPGTVLADSPLAYYRFEEAPGATTLADSSGNGLDIDFSTPLGTTTLGEAGAVGLAAMFNADDTILTPLLLDPSVGDFTIEAVFSVDREVPAPGVILANSNGAGVGRSNLVVDTQGSIHSFSGGGTTASGTIAEDDVFYHVILTFDQSAVAGGVDPTFRFYVNGVAGGTSLLVPEAADGQWLLGSNKDQATQRFAGLLDEIAVYDKRLDDPDGDGDPADSRVTAHFKNYLADSDVLVELATDTDYIDAGGSANLSWRVSPSLTSLTLSDGIAPPVNVLPNTVDCDGGISVSPTATTTYTLEGVSSIGTESLQVTVRVDEPAVIESFSASSETVVAGGTVDLSWAVTNGVDVEIDNGVGAVDPIAGTTTVTVDADTTYTLTASNSQGAVTATVTVAIVTGDPSLVGHWRVGEAPGETAGTTLIAEGGATFNGTFVGSPSFDTDDPAPVPGGSSASIVFDGASSVDVLSWTGVTGTSARTVAFWFKGPSNQPTNNATLVSWGSGATGARFDTRLSNNNRGGTMRTEVAGSGRDSSLFVADDTWHHAAVVIVDDGSPNIGEALFYVDGVLDPAAVGGATAINTASADPVRFGNANRFGRPLVGKLDDIRIYDRALSAEEILALVEADETRFEITGIRRLENGDIAITWTAPPGEYSVEYSFDNQDWSLELTDAVIEVGESSAVTIDNFIANPPVGPAPPRVFYRVLAVE